MSNNNSSLKPENPASKEVGISGKLTKGFLHNPLTPLLLIGFLLLGIVGLIATPRQEDPQISVPMADIFVQYPGASAEQVTNQIAIPLEQEMMEIKGVDHVYSASMREQTVVTVQFVVGEDLEDPIFQGMAVSLLFGVLVSTALTLFIIPLGCYSARDAFLNTSEEELAPSGGDSGASSQGAPAGKTSGSMGSKSAAAIGLVAGLALDISKSAGSAALGLGKSGIDKFKKRKADQANNEGANEGRGTGDS